MSKMLMEFMHITIMALSPIDAECERNSKRRWLEDQLPPWSGPQNSGPFRPMLGTIIASLGSCHWCLDLHHGALDRAPDS